MNQNTIEPAKEIQIRGMVCDRCILVIKSGIEKLGFNIKHISLGKVSFSHGLNKVDQLKLGATLSTLGFEMITSKHDKLVSQVKSLIDEVLNSKFSYDSKIKFTTFLSEHLHLNYDSISKIFSESEGITLERYFIIKRLDKVKDMLVNSNQSITEIAYSTGFSSVNHLSRQFKEFKGLPPSYFKQVGLDVREAAKL